jgi:signal transduction histidine kinase
MSMKLARKLVFAFVAAIFTLLTLYGWHRVSRESALFETDMRRDAHTMGHALEIAIENVWREDGQARALAIIDAANERRNALHIRFVWLDEHASEDERPQLPLSDLDEAVQGIEVVRIDRRRDEGTLFTYVPVSVPSGRPAALEIGESLAQQRAYVRGSIVSTVVATTALGGVCALMALALGLGFVGRPIHALIDQARRIGAGDLSRRLALTQRDEIGELAHEMNSMCDRLDEMNRLIAAETNARIAALEQLRHADRLLTVGKLASGIAHELGTPLNVVTARAKMIATREAEGEGAQANARIIVEQSERMTKIIRQLLDFARRRAAQKASRDLQPIAAQTIALLEPLAQKCGVVLRLDADGPSLRAEVDDGQLQQALTNLVINGIHAMPQGGELVVSIDRERARAPADQGGGDEAEWVRVRVRDHGEGIPDDVREHVFEPFFTTKDVGEGTGLGLSVTYGIVQEHGGFIDVASEHGEGSTFSMYFPRRNV